MARRTLLCASATALAVFFALVPAFEARRYVIGKNNYENISCFGLEVWTQEDIINDDDSIGDSQMDICWAGMAFAVTLAAAIYGNYEYLPSKNRS